jgi:hypothetical protein
LAAVADIVVVGGGIAAAVTAAVKVVNVGDVVAIAGFRTPFVFFCITADEK